MNIENMRVRAQCAERALEIGDSLVSGQLLDGWTRPLELEDEELAVRFEEARRRLEILRGLEFLHGLFVFLDWSAPEIVEFEEDVVLLGGKSLYYFPAAGGLSASGSCGSTTSGCDGSGVQRAA